MNYQTLKIYCILVNLDTSADVKMAVIRSHFHLPPNGNLSG